MHKGSLTPNIDHFHIMHMFALSLYTSYWTVFLFPVLTEMTLNDLEHTFKVRKMPYEFMLVDDIGPKKWIVSQYFTSSSAMTERPRDACSSTWGWVTLSANFLRKGASPTNHCWCQRTRVIALSYGIKRSAVRCLVCHNARVWQTDRRTDRITTPKTALA